MDRPSAGGRIDWLFGVQPSLVRWDMVDFALKDTSGERMVALWLLVSPCNNEAGGLPWLDDVWHKKYARHLGVRLALCELVQNAWKLPDGTDILLACDPRLGGRVADQGLCGVDNVRFWLRGLPDIQLAAGKYTNWQLEAMNVWASRRNDGLNLPRAVPPVVLPEPPP